MFFEEEGFEVPPCFVDVWLAIPCFTRFMEDTSVIQKFLCAAQDLVGVVQADVCGKGGAVFDALEE